MSAVREGSGQAPSTVASVKFAGPTVFHLQGQMDGASAARLRLELNAAVGESTVLLDLTDVVFLDQIGVGVLLGAVRSIHEQGGVVAIGGADSRRGVAAALRGAGVERLVYLNDSLQLALEWLARTAPDGETPP